MLDCDVLRNFDPRTDELCKNVRSVQRFTLRRHLDTGIFEHEFKKKFPIVNLGQLHLHKFSKKPGVQGSTNMESLLARVNMLNNGAFQSVFDGSLLSGGIDRGEVPAWMNLNGIDNIIMDLKEGDDIPSVTKSELILGERASVSAFETGLMEMAQIIVLMPYSYPKVSF